MSDLKTRLEEWALELRERSALRLSGATGVEMLDLLWPVIEAAGVADSYLQGGKEWTYSEYEYVRDRLANALAEMEGKLK